MNILNLLDPELGAKIRAATTTALGIIVALVALLQGVAGVLDALPDWEQIGGIALMVQAAITFLGRFTPVGTKAPQPQE